MKARAGTEYFGIWVSALGGSPTVISSSELYQSLQQGIVDAAGTGPSSFIDRKLYEVAKYMMRNWQENGNFGFVVNLKWWEGLPEDVRSVIEKTSQELGDWTREQAIARDESAWDELEAMEGNVVYTVPVEEIAKWSAIVVPEESKIFKERAGAGADLLMARAEALR